MPSAAHPQAGRPIARRSKRGPRRPDPGGSANRIPEPETPASAGMTDGITITLLQEFVEVLRGRAAIYERRPVAAESGESNDIGTLRGLADEDLAHSRWLAERIAELGGAAEWGSSRDVPAAGPDALPDAVADVKPLWQADITLADAVVDRCGCLLTLVGESDLTTKFLIEDILFDELERSRERRIWLAG